jgi:integrase
MTRSARLGRSTGTARMCFADLLGHTGWTLFSQIRTKDHDTLPAVLTRGQVRDLLASTRLRRYRTPLKLIYCCGLRLSECLGLTIHDIRAEENQLLIRNSTPVAFGSETSVIALLVIGSIRWLAGSIRDRHLSGAGPGRNRLRSV